MLSYLKKAPDKIIKMIQQFLKLIIRIFKRNIFSSLTNIVSIAIGMTAFILVMLWINYESSFDKFNEKGNKYSG